jgi:hypothetical protein
LGLNWTSRKLALRVQVPSCARASYARHGEDDRQTGSASSVSTIFLRDPSEDHSRTPQRGRCVVVPFLLDAAKIVRSPGCLRERIAPSQPVVPVTRSKHPCLPTCDPLKLLISWRRGCSARSCLVGQMPPLLEFACPLPLPSVSGPPPSFGPPAKHLRHAVALGSQASPLSAVESRGEKEVMHCGHLHFSAFP